MDFRGVEKSADRHLYKQIAEIIEKAIQDGELQPRQLIPSEKDIMDQTGASRWAVRHAVEYLREQGRIYTVPHLGSFVADSLPPPRH